MAQATTDRAHGVAYEERYDCQAIKAATMPLQPTRQRRARLSVIVGRGNGSEIPRLPGRQSETN